MTYLEIYNDTAYDLLNAASGVNARLPKVSIQDSGKSCVIHNLSLHGAPSEDVATNLLFIGAPAHPVRLRRAHGPGAQAARTAPWPRQA